MTQGRSIHIGLNHVDPNAYSGWDGALAGCINDARDMQMIANGLGYRSLLLTDAVATADRVIQEIGQAAQELDSGDILFLTYSGHGGQFVDVNGDEPDSLDETWVLWDRQLQDDELYALWSHFAAGVRIVMLSDSCHSGTVLRMVTAYRDLAAQLRRSKGVPRSSDLAALAALADALRLPGPRDLAPAPAGVGTPAAKGAGAAVAETKPTTGANGAAPATAVASVPEIAAIRGMPPDVRALVNAARGTALKAAQYLAGPSARSQIGASIILISGCQDDQVSMDGATNGLFTEKLKQVWDAGRYSGDYRSFWHGIGARMPASQTPNLAIEGVANPAFEQQRPFTIGGGEGSGIPIPIPGGARPTLRRGSKGPDVVYLQQRLQVFGYNLAPDGDFGPKTEAAVRSFQRSNSLAVDGIVGPMTWAALG
jgi:hypothetical protein